MEWAGLHHDVATKLKCRGSRKVQSSPQALTVARLGSLETPHIEGLKSLMGGRSKAGTRRPHQLKATDCDWHSYAVYERILIRIDFEGWKMIEGLHHIQIAMPKGSENDARIFYCGVLGFAEVEKPTELCGRGGIWLQSKNVRLHLGVEEPFAPAKKAHPGFRVSSLENTVAYLEAVGVELRADIDLPDIKRIFVSDPFGNRIELLEVITE